MAAKKKQPGKLKERVQTVTSAAAAGTSSLIAGSGADPVVAVAAATALAVLPQILGAVAERWKRRMQVRAERFLQTIIDTWARDEDKTPDEVAGLLEARTADPDVADAIWRAVRGLMEAPNDAAAVPLGILVAGYTREKRPADAFFRGVVRLLQDLEGSEIQELRQLLYWVASTTGRAEVELVARRGAVDTARDEFVDLVGVDGMTEKRVHTTVVSDPERLFALLAGNGLAISRPHARFDVALPEIALRRSVVERLLHILGTP